jgi:acyl-ACP thioesterase
VRQLPHCLNWSYTTGHYDLYTQQYCGIVLYSQIIWIPDKYSIHINNCRRFINMKTNEKRCRIDHWTLKNVRLFYNFSDIIKYCFFLTTIGSIARKLARFLFSFLQNINATRYRR